MKWVRKTKALATQWLPPLFWGAMLVGHFPLILRVLYKISLGIELTQSGKSLLTLLLASAFFLFKLRGGRLLKTKPTLYQIAAFCLLGVFLHLFLFPPVVLDNPLEFLLLKCLVAVAATLTAAFLIQLIRARRALVSNLEAWVASNRMRWKPGWGMELETAPLRLTLPVGDIIRRGPPCSPLR